MNRLPPRFLTGLILCRNALLCALLLEAFPTLAASLTVGRPAPSLSALTLDGSAFNLAADGKGKVVIVNFWASWCSPCRQEMPALDEFYKEHKADGLLVIAINMDEPQNEKAVRDIMRDFSFPAGFARDAHIEGYGRIWRLPMTFVIDRQGLLRKDGSVGEPKIDRSLLETLVIPLLKASPDPS
ncbi:MAG: Redoxin domain protein [Verrucomicrobiaceae bacterium]|nr:Redoxin domain protein [Verrucomicrobiaceae bacterium]